MKNIQSKNIIKKLQVEVNTNSVTKAMQIKDTIDLFIKEEIYPEIEALLKKYAQEIDHHFIEIDTIEIDVNSNNYNDFKSIIKSKLDSSLRSKISDKKQTVDLSFSKEEKTINALLFFIENGQLPWWYHSVDFFDIEVINSFKNKKQYHQKLVHLLSKPRVQKRVIYQFSFTEIEALFLVAFSININPDYTLNETVKNKILNQQNYTFWSLLFTIVFNKSNPNLLANIHGVIANILKLESNKKANYFIIEKRQINSLINLVNYIVILTKTPISISENGSEKIIFTINKNTNIKEVLKQNLSFGKNNLSSPFISCYYHKENTLSTNQENLAIKRDINLPNDTISKSNIIKEDYNVNTSSFNEEHQVEKDRLNQKNKTTELLIQKAGLVILHPFLPQLFKTLGFYIKGEKHIRTDKIHEATQVLHFLATKNESPYEYELTFEKFLCGIPLNRPINRLQKLSLKQKEECNSLLESVINHWSALKTSNTDTLRSGFLMREGKLTKEKDSNKIYVQRQAHDILLERLPWGLSVINLPWITNITFIEW
ncbi:contractile injection system tape measure protein [Algibacter pacificus]|uniref:contractile injection system tape measure protein n=1 Tax=Algibacter pacificus TaxID=2599389 RepID=UPI0011C85D61|nr:contractile injection system tape measure protein [Algibacter pacificus]